MAHSAVTAHWALNHPRTPAPDRGDLFSGVQNQGVRVPLRVEKRRNLPRPTEGVLRPRLSSRDSKKEESLCPHQKLPKEKGLHFQTPPPAKLRVFFDSGPVMYNSAAEAMEDLRKRGLTLDNNVRERPSEATLMEMLKKLSWMTVEAKRRNLDTHGDRARKTRISPRHHAHSLHTRVNTTLTSICHPRGKTCQHSDLN